MTDRTRQELIEVLTEIGLYAPDWRYGQMVAIFASVARPDSVQSMWDVDDEELLAAARKQLEYFRETRPVPQELLAARQD
jgi:hypothetical protein